MTNGAILHTPIGTGLPGLGLPYLALWLAPPDDDAGDGEGACAFMDAADRPALWLPLPEGCDVLAWPGPAAERTLDHGRLGESVRAAAERHARREFDPDFRLRTLGELWTGPLCLTHDEGLDFVRAATANETPLVQSWAVYLAREHRRVEEGRDALTGEDWASFARLIGESGAGYGAVAGSGDGNDWAGYPVWRSAEAPSFLFAFRWPEGDAIPAPPGAAVRRFSKR